MKRGAMWRGYLRFWGLAARHCDVWTNCRRAGGMRRLQPKQREAAFARGISKRRAPRVAQCSMKAWRRSCFRTRIQWANGFWQVTPPANTNRETKPKWSPAGQTNNQTNNRGVVLEVRKCRRPTANAMFALGTTFLPRPAINEAGPLAAWV